MIRAIDAGLARAEELVIGSLLIAASLLIFVNVVGRYVFSTGIVWAEELVRYAIVWMVFIGASVAARKGIHIGVDALVRVLPSHAQRIVTIAINALCIVFCVVLVIYGADLVRQTWAFGQRTPALQAPFWIVQLAVPVGAALMALRFAQQALLELRHGRHRTELEILG